MPLLDITIRLAGENGEGLLTVGDQLAVTLSRMGLKVYTFQNLPAEIKGGASMAQIRFSDEPVLSPGDRIDILEIWNQENYDRHIGEAAEDTILLYDPKDTTPDERAPRRSYPVPLDRIAREEVQAIRSKNVVAWSIFLALLGVGKERAIEQFHRSRWAKRKESLEANLRAIDAGYAYGAQLIQESGIAIRLPADNAADRREQMILNGNTAIGLGSIAGGLQFYAGYPITPASDIMEFLAKNLPKFGGVVVQTEDEIAALAAVIGASYAGRTALTATSGPGLSLMVEEIALAQRSGNIYSSTRFNDIGSRGWVQWLTTAAQHHDEHWLAYQLEAAGAMKHLETKRARLTAGYTVAHVPDTAAETMAEGQFNRFYMAALCRRAIADGKPSVRVYRAKQRGEPRPESRALEGTSRDANTLLEELRSRELSLKCDLLKPNSGLSIDC